MSKKSTIQRDLEDLQSDMNSRDELRSLLQSIQQETVTVTDDEAVRLKLPYVSAEPIYPRWVER